MCTEVSPPVQPSTSPASQCSSLCVAHAIGAGVVAPPAPVLAASAVAAPAGAAATAGAVPGDAAAGGGAPATGSLPSSSFFFCMHATRLTHMAIHKILVTGVSWREVFTTASRP